LDSSFKVFEGNFDFRLNKKIWEVRHVRRIAGQLGQANSICKLQLELEA